MHSDMVEKLQGLGQFAEGPLADMLEQCKEDGQFVRLVSAP